MFGTNPLRKQVLDDGASLRVQSIFPTIQGEGPFAGVPAVFCRFAGCNLKCHFCDTNFESNYQNLLSVNEIIRQIIIAAQGSITLVVITGGEPLRQNILLLCTGLTESGFTVQIETAGTLWVPGLEELIEQGRVTLVCSPKTGKVNPFIFLYCQHWKYLICEGEVAEEDGLPNTSTQTRGEALHLARPARVTDTVWLQPCEVYDVKKTRLTHQVMEQGDLEEVWFDQHITSAARNEAATKRNMQFAAQLAIRFNYRLSLQLHKIIGLE